MTGRVRSSYFRGSEAKDVHPSRRPQLRMKGEAIVLMTKRKPATVGEILVEEFMRPMGLTQAALAAAMGVQRKHVNELCNNRRNVTAATALILARVFGNSPDFWLNVQRRTDLWEAMNSPRERERIKRAKRLGAAA
jgi:antitoxin HigA-1